VPLTDINLLRLKKKADISNASLTRPCGVKAFLCDYGAQRNSTKTATQNRSG
jgi:hypothetical protein